MLLLLEVSSFHWTIFTVKIAYRIVGEEMEIISKYACQATSPTQR